MSEGSLPPPPPNCKCSPPMPSQRLTVAKEGPNKGRQFYTCARRGCNFFQWAETSNHHDSSRNNSANNHNNINGNSNSTMMGNTSRSVTTKQSSSSSSVPTTTNLQIPTCRKHSNTPCRLLQVVKEGPNKGKLFWACGMSSQNERCNHFGWFEGNVELYKHLVPNYSTPPSASSSSLNSSFNNTKDNEVVEPIVMSATNQNNLWVAGLPIEIFREIFKSLELPDQFKLQCVCKEWKRMFTLAVSMHTDMDLNFGFLKEYSKSTPPYSWWCRIISMFLYSSRVIFCNMKITNELMRLIEFMPNLKTLVFNNCSTVMSNYQVDVSVHDPVEDYPDEYYENFDWHSYWHGGFAGNLTKEEIEAYKKTHKFKSTVTQMMFSKMDEDKDVIIPHGLKDIEDETLFHKQVGEEYKLFVTNVSSRIPGFKSKRKLEALKHIICVESRAGGMNFSWINKDRKVYYKCIDAKCERNIDSFFDKANTTCSETDIVPEKYWKFKQLLVQDRAISLIFFSLMNHRSSSFQIYNGINCDAKSVVDRVDLSVSKQVEIYKHFCLWKNIDPNIIPTNNIDLLKFAIAEGSLKLTQPLPQASHLPILKYQLDKIREYSRKMVSGDKDELTYLCKKHSIIGMCVDLLVFIHKHHLMTQEVIDSCLEHVQKIDEYWTHQSFIASDEDDNDANDSVGSLPSYGPVSPFPFSWTCLLKFGKFSSNSEQQQDDENIENNENSENSDTNEEMSENEEEPEEEQPPKRRIQPQRKKKKLH
ncbi:hypothetical protein C9374_013894 [Naegleria lovaniensis]|uniref:F-box domain-containing protein n=1 Tax=Naegleria lovaniensis TaxID=51637 RepID=A0AA88KPP0_NAELO|nr:uncharacterized protein C9374_013894 [Naegleria lovaniensis]KAG2389334.1 hypothetical protein C9374_013894 [Naegleria lovaniensis]